tara:strand:+ start:17 stop:844 length:828 start_codon:yes stop_codon:yes gene_type:complete
MKSKDYNKFLPKRIVCLTEETTETLYLLEEQDRIVGISSFTVRPAIAKKEKPKVSSFIDAHINKILALKPDLVIGYSDIQADIAHKLIKIGISVWVNNYRDIKGIKSMIFQLGILVGKQDKSLALIEIIDNKFFEISKEVKTWKRRPRVYFEEWDSPMISAILWVSEIINSAGGNDIFSCISHESLAKGRIVEDSNEVVKENPEIILISWCGKKFNKKEMINRPNWNKINAIKNNYVYEIPSEIILQPGPASLLDGLDAIHSIFKEWNHNNKTTT